MDDGMATNHGASRKLISAVAWILLIQLSTTVRALDCSSLSAQDASEAEIRRVDVDWSKAYYTGDKAFLECLYAANFFSADSSGVLHSREDDISGSSKFIGKTWIPNQHQYQREVRMYAHTAIVTMLRGDTSHGLRITDVYEYDGRRWRATFSQDTKY